MGRLPFIDWARGFAVAAMVLWHTGDAWLRLDQRQGQLWLALRFVGGLAAPGFIFLAGTSAALAARPAGDGPSAARTLRATAARALEVLLIGYLLRLQTWLLDAGALVRWDQARAWAPIALGYGLMLLGLRRLKDAPLLAGRLATLGLLSWGVGLVQVEAVAPGRLARLLQVDVLQAIGASLLLLAIGQRYCQVLSRPGWLAGLSVVVAAATHSITLWMPGPLPPALAGYLAKYDVPAGTPPAALFPLFPWLAYALAGAAWGALVKRSRGHTETLLVACAVLGAAAAVVSSEAQPFVHRLLAAEPWLVQPVRVVFRVSLVLILLLVGWVWADRGRGKWFLAYGQNSMRIYWAHMLFAYGILGRALHKKLDFAGWALWLIPLLGAMWWLTRWQGSGAKPAPEIVRT